MSERGSSLGRYEPIPTIPEDSPISSEQSPATGRHTSTEPRLAFSDFWPNCRNAEDPFSQLRLDRFDTLLPRANAWLRDHPDAVLIKCETLERKVWCSEQLGEDFTSPTFEAPNNVDTIFYIKGLRLWFTGRSSDPLCGRPNARVQQIGYRNYMPRCLDANPKFPAFEDLGPMYAGVNENLIERPIEGPIITMETIPIRMDRLNWDGPAVEVDRTYWPMTPKQHVFFFTRIFYLFQCPAYEQVGAADFLPDEVRDSRPTPKSGLPKYTNLALVMNKFNSWIKQVKDIRVINIQSLEAAFTGKSDLVRTNCNFLSKVDTTHMIRFIRVTYTRPKFGLPPSGLCIPVHITQRTFVPRVVETEDEPVILEDLSLVEKRIKAWLKHVDNDLISVEVLYHPLKLLSKRYDEGETTVLPGEWQPLAVETINRKQSMQPAQQAQIVRIYLEGEFREPSEELLQQTMVQPGDDTECCKLL